MTPDWQTLLDFWFGELTDGQANKEQRERWFTVSPQFDEDCRRFASWLGASRAGELDHWLTAPESCLAFIVLTDQLPRNIHRGTALAFAWDDLARNAAYDGIKQRLDLALGADQRAFFYMPFEHSESLLDQHMAVGLFTALRDASTKAQRSNAGNNLRFAQQHRDIILRFGRFPHRNAALGRESSAKEKDYLQQSDGFGQLQPDNDSD